MASTDIDGKPIVILSEDEAMAVYNALLWLDDLDPIEQKIIRKIERDLKQ